MYLLIFPFVTFDKSIFDVNDAELDALISNNAISAINANMILLLHLLNPSFGVYLVKEQINYAQPTASKYIGIIQNDLTGFGYI